MFLPSLTIATKASLTSESIKLLRGVALHINSEEYKAIVMEDGMKKDYLWNRDGFWVNIVAHWTADSAFFHLL